MAAFLRLCGQAASTACAFSAGTPAATQAKWNTLLRHVGKEPVTAGGQTFTYADLISSVSGALQTVSDWQQEAVQLQQLWNASRGSAPADRGSAPAAAAARPSAVPAAPAAAPVYDGQEQGFAELCADGPEPTDLAAWTTGAKLAFARSGGFGLSWAWGTEGCAQWPGGGDGYHGPWNRPTANPVLVVSNTDDAVLPYPNSVALARDLGNARLLSVRGFGHEVLANPSTSPRTTRSATWRPEPCRPPAPSASRTRRRSPRRNECRRASIVVRFAPPAMREFPPSLRDGRYASLDP